MLTSNALIPPTDAERALFLEVVPADHCLRRVLACVDFEAFRPMLEAAYTGFGRPPLDCLFLLKVELLARQHRLSDREVIEAIRYNIAFRLFLAISLKSPLPHPTVLTYFRQRQGPERLRQVFDNLVGQARQLGLVKDRLRLKDATHIIANIAVPSTIRLVAETRDQLLDALRPFAAERVVVEEQRAAAIGVGTAEAKDEERLVQRVTHLRAVVAWADMVPLEPGYAAANPALHERLQAALQLAHKVLADRDDPDAGDKVLSVQDSDARCGKHGDFYDGYLVDIAMDADSEIITAVNVLPANGNEGADAATLIRQEEAAHGNDVAAISLDGAGFCGPVLRDLTDPQGLNLDVYTPPKDTPPAAGFPPERFPLTVIDDRPTLTCPAGQTTTQRERNRYDTGTKFRFSQKQCRHCPLRGACLATPTTKSRTVIKTDYEPEYRAARATAQTPAYAEVRKQHPAIERKLGELVNRHDLRHARYRGLGKVLYQGVLTSLVVNLKRIVRLLITPAAPAQGPVRADLVGLS